MQRKKVLLVGLPNLLREILAEAIGRASHYVVSVTSNEHTRIERVVAEQSIDTLVFALEEHELKQVGPALLRKFPGLAMFSVCGDGRTLLQLELRPVVVAHGEAFIEQLLRLIEVSATPDQ